MTIEEMQSRSVSNYVGADKVELVGTRDYPRKRNGRTSYDHYLIFAAEWDSKRIRISVMRDDVSRRFKTETEEEKRILYEVRSAFQRFKSLVLAARAYRHERPLL